MSNLHISSPGVSHERELGGTAVPLKTAEFLPAPTHPVSRSAYVPPIFRRIDVVRTAGGAAGADDGLDGAS